MNAWLQTAAGTATVAALLLGIAGGLTGVFVVARRMALTGDMLSHAVLPGVVAGLLWSPERNPFWVLSLAILAGLAGTGLMLALARTTRLKPDAALGIVLSVFFAAGIAMISRWQPGGVQAYLFGQAAAISMNDLRLLAGTTAVVVVFVVVGFRVLAAASFDPRHARTLGVPVEWIDRMFFMVLSAATVVAMQAVGVVLVSALLITPAVAAARISRRLAVQAVWACGFGVLGSLAGVWLSLQKSGLPTGPLMALSLVALFLAAALCGPRDGLLWRFGRRFGMRRRIARENLLKAVWSVAEGREDAAVGLEELAARLREPIDEVKARAALLVKAAEAEWASAAHSGVVLTPLGRRRAAEMVRKHRLWELYLTERASYAADHVHDEAERAEHWISEEHARRLEEVLKHPERDPHGRAIPRVGKEGKP